MYRVTDVVDDLTKVSFDISREAIVTNHVELVFSEMACRIVDQCKHNIQLSLVLVILHLEKFKLDMIYDVLGNLAYIHVLYPVGVHFAGFSDPFQEGIS